MFTIIFLIKYKGRVILSVCTAYFLQNARLLVDALPQLISMGSIITFLLTQYHYYYIIGL